MTLVTSWKEVFGGSSIQTGLVSVLAVQELFKADDGTAAREMLATDFLAPNCVAQNEDDAQAERT